ncbi:hypothetical protein Poli38472_001983 [Pythium oligandrum]|uniref:RRM domain-containing protein n=1 Tax=Pythium oligandrum TaxID=41045 RepID=A0A8K1FSA1_PYTOL|nr:hypothetical protein Poli38472_001983 [Pythium oligandrum]|eukprot:TMW69827.1 hypothetical protein Poli38472_001983 [Pythium oligandrum]
MAAEDDIDSLLEQGIKAAAAEASAKEDVVMSTDNDKGNDAKAASRRRHRSSASKSRSRSASRSRSRSRSTSRSRKSRRSSRRSRSRSRSSRRRSSRRSRSRSRSSRRPSSRRDRRRSRSRSRERRRRSRRSKSAENKKEPRPRSTSAERAERAKQRELMELTRDHRTVFVGQLTQKVRERDLEKFFTQLGKIEHVLLIRDKFTNRSKGFAYVEMSNLEDIPKVLMLNGQVPDFQSFPIMIKASEAEKNFAARKDSVMNSAAKGGIGGGSLSAASRIYCGNLHTNITEDDLRAVFQAFGEVLSVNINRDEMGRSRGFGFIQFNTPQEANFALSKGNGIELAGNYLKLGCVNENAGESTSSGGWRLDDDEGNLSMNSQSRSALMAKLAGNKNIFPNPVSGSLFPVPGAAAPSASVVTQEAERAAALASTDIEGSESFCFVIKNMFDVQAEKRSGNPDWQLEIKQDVEEECENYGPVLHSYVEGEKAGGLVYVLFDRIESATTAAKRLHGRWFSQRQISVRYLSPQEYVGMFPEARSAVQTARANEA